MSSAEATFRYFGDLVDLLTVPEDAGVVARTFDGSPSVKDQIEACGVPHTEVDLILANGRSVGFGYRLRGADSVSVYPRFYEFDVGSVSRVRPEHPPAARFVVDVNLGRLARYLRLLGFDSASDGSLEDVDLAALSVEESRVLLTRDRPLLKRAVVEHGYLVRAIDPDEQIVEVLRRFDLADSMKPFARCMECNGVMRSVPKTEVVHLLEPLTRKHFEDFRQCEQCDRVFWRGSHFERLRALVEEIRLNLA